MTTDEAALKILENHKKKFRCLNRVHDLTKELERVIDSGDVDVLKITVEMRQQQLDVCRQMDAETERLVKKLPPEESARYFKLTHHQESPPEQNSQIEEDIYSMTERIARQLEKTIVYDRQFTNKFKRTIRK